MLEVPSADLARLAVRLAPAHRTADIAPDTFPELWDSAERGELLTVWSGASNASIYGASVGNYAFRAWHDNLHLRHALTFDIQDEYRLAELQAHQSGKLGRYIYADVAGQIAYFERYQAFPVDQIGYVRAFIQSETSALARRW